MKPRRNLCTCGQKPHRLGCALYSRLNWMTTLEIEEGRALRDAARGNVRVALADWRVARNIAHDWRAGT